MFQFIAANTTHLLFCKVLPFSKNILQKDPSLFCPSADGCPPVSKVLEGKKNTKKYLITFLNTMQSDLPIAQMFVITLS